MEDSEQPIHCAMWSHEASEDAQDNYLYVVVYPDGTHNIYCAGCIKRNMDFWHCGTLIFNIGDDVTAQFL